MIIQIVVVGIAVAGAVLMFLLGYLIATRKSNANINEITEDFTSKVITLRKQNKALKKQLRDILKEQSDIHTAYRRIKNDTALHGEIFNRIKNSNETLSFNYVKLQKELTRINRERASLLNKLQTLESKALPATNKYQRVQQELETVQSKLSVQRLDNKSLSKVNDILTVDKQRLLVKLKKVFKEYKRLVAIVVPLKKKASEIKSLKKENEKLTRAYEEAADKLKQLGHQAQFLDDIENDRKDLAVTFEVVKTPKEGSDASNSNNENSRAQNM